MREANNEFQFQEARRNGLTDLWDQLLTCQVRLTTPFELPYLYMCKQWCSTEFTLDLGTGNGAHLAELVRCFPTKRFVGIDVNPALLEYARRRLPPSVSLQVGDLFKFRGTYPSIVCRLVAQHLSSVPDFVQTVWNLLQPGGIFISIEPDDATRIFYPDCPTIRRLYEDFIAARTKEGFDRDAGRHMVAIAEGVGLAVIGQAAIHIPSTIPGYRSLFAEFHELILRNV